MASIVIVEDERVLRRTLARNLTGLQHEVRAAESAEEGLELVRNEPPDLVITDHRLPGMTGHDFRTRRQRFLKRFKEDGVPLLNKITDNPRHLIDHILKEVLTARA